MNLAASITIHAGGPGSGCRGPNCGRTKGAFQKQMLSNLKVMSRTSHGIGREANRPGLEKAGDKLAEQADTNFRNALDWVWEHKEDDLGSGPQVRSALENLANRVSENLLKPGQSKYRTWEDANYKPAADIQKNLDSFSQELSERLKGDPQETSAWAEKELQRVHPFADGVGRTSMLLAGLIAAHHGTDLPTYRSREEHFRAMNAPGKWEGYYKSLFSK